MLYHTLLRFEGFLYRLRSLGHTIPSVVIDTLRPEGYASEKESLKTVYGTIPQGKAVLVGTSGVPSIAVVTYRSLLFMIGEQSYEICLNF